MAAAVVPTTTNQNVPEGSQVPNRVFVGGICPEATEEELKEHFSPHGVVKDAKIINDKQNVSKGYGFVTFETEDDANHILEMVKENSDAFQFRGRKLNLGPAIRKASKQSDVSTFLPSYYPPMIPSMQYAVDPSMFSQYSLQYPAVAPMCYLPQYQVSQTSVAPATLAQPNQWTHQAGSYPTIVSIAPTGQPVQQAVQPNQVGDYQAYHTVDPSQFIPVQDNSMLEPATDINANVVAARNKQAAEEAAKVVSLTSHIPPQPTYMPAATAPPVKRTALPMSPDQAGKMAPAPHYAQYIQPNSAQGQYMSHYAQMAMRQPYAQQRVPYGGAHHLYQTVQISEDQQQNHHAPPTPPNTPKTGLILKHN